MTQSSESQPQEAQGKPPISGGKAIMLLLAIFVIAVILAVTGIIPRLRARTTLRQQTDSLAAPDVLVQKPTRGQPTQELALPGTTQAYTDSPIYARTNGYLKKWYFDIGAHVKQGQLLAVIESPEIDQELAQGKQDLATAEANAGYAKIQAARYQELLKSNAVATQDTDNFTTQQAATATQVKSAQANVARLEQLVGFEKIYAPFNGTVTARNVDIGTLINSGASTANSAELFHMVAEDVLRIYVNVPQAYSYSTVPGVIAQLTLTEKQGSTYQGKIVRTAKAIDPTSRTLLVEVDVDNRKGELYPGAYMQVHFKLTNAHPWMIIPVSTLMFRSEGLRVAVVNNNIAKLVPITIGRDDGRTVEVASGLQDSDEVIQNPPDSLIDGEQVHIIQPNQTGEPEQPGGGK
ncbi:MAG TPA: efflux RND transporter periplasmic adaptor subunit [Silvibacterium sp.]|nr:efflux RND transporter periplasmic adaptor subunit [Silvibacterium sp.]